MVDYQTQEELLKMNSKFHYGFVTAVMPSVLQEENIQGHLDPVTKRTLLSLDESLAQFVEAGSDLKHLQITHWDNINLNK